VTDSHEPGVQTGAVADQLKQGRSNEAILNRRAAGGSRIVTMKSFPRAPGSQSLRVLAMTLGLAGVGTFGYMMVRGIDRDAPPSTMSASRGVATLAADLPNRNDLAQPLQRVSAETSVPIAVPDVIEAIEKAVEGWESAQGKKIRESALVVREEFGQWMKMADDAGIAKVPDGFVVPTELYDAFAAAHGRYEAALKTIDAVRMPIVHRLVEQRIASGAYEQCQNPESLTDAAAAKIAKAALRAARKPTVPDQSVTVSGDAMTFRIVRVNPTDDPVLPALYETVAAAKREYLHGVYVLVAPYLGR